MSKNSKLDTSTGETDTSSSTDSPTSDHIQGKIDEVNTVINILTQRRDELQKAKAGQQNLDLLTGKNGGEPYNLDKANWKESNYKKGIYWIGKDEVPDPIKMMPKDKFPITSPNYKYYLTSKGNLQRYEI